ncbi:MAG: sulfatase-like hydrolase/transferase [Anaerolineae bacterium]|nr:sulfatase-like hydrolase/transferase [Gemmatimonadaceae bacterium]
MIEGQARARDIWICAVWFALIAGLAEVALLTLRQLALGHAIGLSRHYLWMTPLGGLIIYAIPAAVLVLAARRWPAFVTIPRVSGVFAFLGGLGALHMYPRLHSAARLFLAAGVAVQVARMIAARPIQFRRLATASSVAMAALIAVMGIAVGASGWWRERQAVAALAAPTPNAPNVLLIILDTVRAASMSLYGHQRPTTPNLERIAKNGIVFDNAVSTAPWTLSSHASMFTGKFAHELSANWRVPLDDSTRTLSEILTERGYLTAGFAANTFYASYEHGLDRGFTHYEDYRITLGQVLNSSSLGFLIFDGRAGFGSNILRRMLGNYQYLGRKKAPHVNANFLDWLSGKGNRPYFAFLNYMDAHCPYIPDEEFRIAFGATTPREGLSRGCSVERDSSYDLRIYDASIAYLDHHVGLLFEELERRGELRNTLVIITSDHGELLGEHGLFEHANSLYMPLLHVPLVMSFPGRLPAGGRRIAEGVTLRSLPSTVLDLVGAQPSQLPGTSLANLWNGTPTALDPLVSGIRKGINEPQHHPIAKGDMISIVTEAMHYIRNGDGREELYDLRADPYELSDLAPRGENAAALERARNFLKASASGSDRPAAGAGAHPLAVSATP